MNIGARQTLLNNSQNNIKPIMWFDAINNAGKNQHVTLNSSTPWKSLVNSDIYDAITFGGNPTWNNNSVQFSSTSQIYAIRKYGNNNGFWQDVCNRKFSLHVVATLTSLQYWNGICGGGQDTLELLGIGIRCNGSAINIGEMYSKVKIQAGHWPSGNSDGNSCYNCPASLFSLNDVHCIDIIADIDFYKVYIDGILQWNVPLDLNTPWIFGEQLIFKIGCGWTASTNLPSDQILKGKFHELQVFNVAISDENVRQLVETSIQRYS